VEQSLELNIWLGLALFALVSAQILLWRTRHVLCKAQRESLVQEVRTVPSAVRVPTVALVPSAMAEPVGSVVPS
jgi:hypothetical protein